MELSYNNSGNTFLLRPPPGSAWPSNASRLVVQTAGVRWYGPFGGERTAVLPATRYHALQLTGIPELRMTGEAKEQLGKLLQEIAKARQALISPPGRGHKDIFKAAVRKPYPHQVQAVQALKAMGWRGLLADDPGVGKTLPAIIAYRLSGADRCLVVCKGHLKWKWAREFLLEGITAHVVHGPRKRRLRQLEENDDSVVIINYELLRTPGDEPTVEPLIESFVDGQFLIVDESHWIKSPGAIRTKMVAQLKERGCLLLSGTPIRNMCDDLYAQLTKVQPNIFRNTYEFLDRFTVRQEIRVGRRKRRIVVANRAQDELAKITSCFMVRRTMDQVARHLPPLLPPTIVELDWDEASLSAYKLMRDRWLYYWGDLDDDLPIFDDRARNACEAAIRLEQITSGYLGGVIPATPCEEEAPPLGLATDPLLQRHRVFEKHPKYAYLVELQSNLAAAGNKLVVFSRFRAPLHHLEKHFEEKGVATWCITGETRNEDRDEAIQDFETSEKGVFLCSVGIAEGFDLASCHHVAFLSRDWSPAVNEQARARCRRLVGTTSPVSTYIPVIRDSIDEYQGSRLDAKQSDQLLVLGDLKRLIERQP